MFQDLLLHLDTYPDAAPIERLDEIVDFCCQLGAGLSALAVQVRIDVHSNPMAERLLSLSGLAREQERKSEAAAEALITRFSSLAAARGVRHETQVIRSDHVVVADDVAQCARTHDLLVVPQATLLDGQRSVAEPALFASGRPVVLLPLTAARRFDRLDQVIVAWDGSRSAARAVADALPLLAAAGRIEIVTVSADKPAVGPTSAANLVRHLARHGVQAEVTDLEPHYGSAAAAIATHAAKAGDLLVMGGYGHARMLEFVLGGVTEHMLAAPPVPIFLSH